MSLGDGNGLSAADIMALSNNNDGFGGGAVINGDYYNNWNSADEVPLYFYTKE